MSFFLHLGFGLISVPIYNMQKQKGGKIQIKIPLIEHVQPTMWPEMFNQILGKSSQKKTNQKIKQKAPQQYSFKPF